MYDPRRLMMTVFIVVLVAACVLWGLVRYLETHAVFFPGKTCGLTPSAFGIPFEELDIMTSDGEKINAWFVKGSGNGATIIYAHGNAGTMSDRLLKLKFFHELKLNVLLFDYRGYGKSSGTPSEKGVYLDGQAAFDHAASRADVDRGKIIMYGASLGGIVAVDVASHRPCLGLIVDSSITSAKDAAKIFYPYLPAFLMSLRFDSISKIAHLTMPKLIIHSPEDKIVPFAMGERLFQAAAGPKTFVRSSGGHNEIQIVSDAPTREAFKVFLTSLGVQ